MFLSEFTLTLVLYDLDFRFMVAFPATVRFFKSFP